ncbi:MAG TPA: EAL domain-containing protein, partial [Pyrinomonadaceae bacterium]
GHISVSDTFIFLTILQFGGDVAVLLAALDGLCTSLRFSKRPMTIICNTGVMALSTFLTVEILRAYFGPLHALAHASYSPSFFVAIILMGMSQYVINSGLIATIGALKVNQPLWQTWKNNYLWTSITYFAGASAAGLVAKLIDVAGFYACVATIPIIGIVYVTYRTYQKNIESSSAQAELAHRHVEELSQHIAEQERISKELARNVAEQERIARALQESEERFRSAFDYAAIGMAVVSTEGQWLQVNRSLCEIVGYSESELLGTDFQSLTHPDDLGPALVNVHQLMDGKLPACQLEKRYVHKLGHYVWVLWSVSLATDAQTKSLSLIFQIQDITDRKRAEERLLHDAFHDALTGLPNRALFMDHLKLAIARAKRREDYEFAVLFLDLDRFKIINDSLGHMVGDQLLVGIARRLETCLRPGDTVARLGGDEFTILLDDIKDTGEAIQVAERVEKELALPFNLSGHEVFTSISVGIAPSNIGYDRPDDILRDADTAMYRAKSLGKSRHEVFDKAMHSHAMNLLQLETDLRRAVERQEFLVHYQPIVSLETGTLRGFEALVRWQHPEHGFISPAEFVPVAEETGLIIPIGHWVLQQACRQMREWQEQFPHHPPLMISVNLSSKQFTQPDLIEQIKLVLDETGLNPASLKLEITESVVMENIETAIGMLRQLRALGVESSIDDFGTGYSSLSYLHRFPATTLKIDRSFVSRMNDHGENVEIVRTVLMLARNLSMSVVAEGVETREQLEQLQRLGCELGQGYLFSKPVAAGQATAILLDDDSIRIAAATPDTVIRYEDSLAA